MFYYHLVFLQFYSFLNLFIYILYFYFIAIFVEICNIYCNLYIRIIYIIHKKLTYLFLLFLILNFIYILNKNRDITTNFKTFMAISLFLYKYLFTFYISLSKTYSLNFSKLPLSTDVPLSILSFT